MWPVVGKCGWLDFGNSFPSNVLVCKGFHRLTVKPLPVNMDLFSKLPPNVTMTANMPT